MTRPLLRPFRLSTLALLGAVAGCGGGSSESVDMGQGRPDLPPIVIDVEGPPVRYRITELHVPTLEDVWAGVPVGHNVDRRGDACGVPDFPGGVDNALIDLSTALTSFEPPTAPVDLQAAIDTALACPPDAEPSVCTRLDLIVTVTSGVGLTVVSIEDAEGASLAAPFVGSLDGSGNLHATAMEFTLAIPYQAPDGPVTISLRVRDMRLSATVTTGTLTNLVLGGAIHDVDFEAMLMDVLPRLGDQPTFEDVQSLLAGLYDVEVELTCSALSVGFTGVATAVAAPATPE
ncbi:MAG: hypothetical protein R3B40_26965 [Polyangiales bacterium]